MINDSLFTTFYKFHDYKQKIVKAYKKFLFPLKFKIFEIRGFDLTVTIYIYVYIYIYIYMYNTFYHDLI